METCLGSQYWKQSPWASTWDSLFLPCHCGLRNVFPRETQGLWSVSEHSELTGGKFSCFWVCISFGPPGVTEKDS